jgi:hypothetical protein
LLFEQCIELFSGHIDLVGSILDEQQRGEFMRTQHRSLHGQSNCLGNRRSAAGVLNLSGAGQVVPAPRSHSASGNWSVVKRPFFSKSSPQNFLFDNCTGRKRFTRARYFAKLLQVSRASQHGTTRSV